MVFPFIPPADCDCMGFLNLFYCESSLGVACSFNTLTAHYSITTLTATAALRMSSIPFSHVPDAAPKKFSGISSTSFVRLSPVNSFLVAPKSGGGQNKPSAPKNPLVRESQGAWTVQEAPLCQGPWLGWWELSTWINTCWIGVCG